MNAVFTKSDNGVRIKTWARPGNGFVKHVVFQNIVMNNVKNPIIIDQNYCPDNEGCPGQVTKLLSFYKYIKSLISVGLN